VGFVVVAIDRYIVCATVAYQSQCKTLLMTEVTVLFRMYIVQSKSSWNFVHVCLPVMVEFTACLLSLMYCCHTGLPALVQLLEMFLHACFCYLKNATGNILSLLRRGGNHCSTDRDTELVEAEWFTTFVTSLDIASYKMESVIIMVLLWV